jgi:hypothetical protein
MAGGLSGVPTSPIENKVEYIFPRKISCSGKATLSRTRTVINKTKTQIHATGPELYHELSGLCIQSQAAGSPLFGLAFLAAETRWERKKRKYGWRAEGSNL